jgi:Flp pilus assembly protein CpaB
MRASTLFAITLSVLLGLGAVAGARYAGLFDKAEPPPTQPEKPPVVRVLVPVTHLYAGIAVQPEYVVVKEMTMTPDDLKRYGNRFLPPYPSAVQFRIPKQNIAPSDSRPLTEDMFEPHDLPRSISERLDAKTAPVNVAVSKSKSVGGTIRVGEYVDVWLSTKYTVGTGRNAVEKVLQGCIAKDCKVVMKRDIIWPVMQADPDNAPVKFTLQANPYRAAFIEFAQTKGELSLRPTTPPATKSTGSFSDLSRPDYIDEDARVNKIMSGEYVVGDADLMRVFKLAPPVAPPPPAPPVPPRRTLVYYGTNMAGAALYDPYENKPYEGPSSGRPAGPQAPNGPVSPAAVGQPTQPQPQQQQMLPYTFGDRGRKSSDGCENCGDKD